LGSGGVVPLILDLCIRWRSVVNFTPRPLYFRGKDTGIQWRWGWANPRAGLDAVA